MKPRILFTMLFILLCEVVSSHPSILQFDEQPLNPGEPSPRYIIDPTEAKRNAQYFFMALRPKFSLRTIGFHQNEGSILVRDYALARHIIHNTIQYFHKPSFQSSKHLFEKYFPVGSESYVEGVFQVILKRSHVNVFKSKQDETYVAQAQRHDNDARVFINKKGSYFVMTDLERAGVFIHELSHHVGTRDESMTLNHPSRGPLEMMCYGKRKCQFLSKLPAQRFKALTNADSYNHFAMDVQVAVRKGLIKVKSDGYDPNMKILVRESIQTVGTPRRRT